MKTLKRNQQILNYCRLLESETKVYDENGNWTGERVPIYSAPQEMYANISPASGVSATQIFGDLDQYDHVVVTDDTNCQMDESSVLFIGKDYEETVVDAYKIVPIGPGLNPLVVPIQYSQPKNNYIVVRVSRSLNSIAYAVRKVPVS